LGFPEALRVPSVAVGGSMSTERFWMGAKMDEWANSWMAYMTDSRAAFVTAGQNDIGSLVAIESLGQAGRADPNRVLLLRTASDFTRQAPNASISEYISSQQHGSYTAYDAAIEALYRVGSPVVHSLLKSDPKE
jgi:purine nucleoside permease